VRPDTNVATVECMVGATNRMIVAFAVAIIGVVAATIDSAVPVVQLAVMITVLVLAIMLFVVAIARCAAAITGTELCHCRSNARPNVYEGVEALAAALLCFFDWVRVRLT